MLRAGLIGLPSTGKSTLFQLLIQGSGSGGKSGKSGKSDAQIGVASVPDARLDRLTALYEPKKHVPATVNVADVPGASSGHSLVDVSAFREADALLHIVRAFEAPEIPHVAESVDPARDVQTVEDELILADLGVAEKRLERIARDRKKGLAKDAEREAELIDRCRVELEEGRAIRGMDLDAAAQKTLSGFQFLSAKPLLLVLNVDESAVADPDGAVDAAQLGGILAQDHTLAMAVCAKIELEIAELDAADAATFLADLGLEEPGLNRVARAAYQLLGYISFFTVGKDECRAWSIPAHTPARAAAGEIHTDIERGFIRAEVVHCDPLLARGSLAACREHGEVRLEGKEYEVRDGDVINFRFSV